METLHHYSSRGVHDSLAADYTLAPPQGRSVDEKMNNAVAGGIFSHKKLEVLILVFDIGHFTGDDPSIFAST